MKCLISLTENTAVILMLLYSASLFLPVKLEGKIEIRIHWLLCLLLWLNCIATRLRTLVYIQQIKRKIQPTTSTAKHRCTEQSMKSKYPNILFTLFNKWLTQTLTFQKVNYAKGKFSMISHWEILQYVNYKTIFIQRKDERQRPVVRYRSGSYRTEDRLLLGVQIPSWFSCIWQVMWLSRALHRT